VYSLLVNRQLTRSSTDADQPARRV